MGTKAGAERTENIQCMSDSGRMEARTKRTRLSAGVRTRAERTRNMAYMVVTLDVSKLSGWLNADANCQVGGRCYEAKRGARKEMRAVGQLSAAQPFCRGRADWGLGAGHGEERTPNMKLMSVTLEVSKLSGWLNADAPCRESKGGHAMRGEVQTGRPEVAGDRGARGVQGKARL